MGLLSHWGGLNSFLLKDEWAFPALSFCFMLLFFKSWASCFSGSGSLKIDFVGELNDKMKGFYRSKYTTPSGENRYAAVTQFEVNSYQSTRFIHFFARWLSLPLFASALPFVMPFPAQSFVWDLDRFSRQRRFHSAYTFILANEGKQAIYYTGTHNGDMQK